MFALSEERARVFCRVMMGEIPESENVMIQPHPRAGMQHTRKVPVIGEIVIELTNSQLARIHNISPNIFRTTDN